MRLREVEERVAGERQLEVEQAGERPARRRAVDDDVRIVAVVVAEHRSLARVEEHRCRFESLAEPPAEPEIATEPLEAVECRLEPSAHQRAVRAVPRVGPVADLAVLVELNPMEAPQRCSDLAVHRPQVVSRQPRKEGAEIRPREPREDHEAPRHERPGVVCRQHPRDSKPGRAAREERVERNLLPHPRPGGVRIELHDHVSVVPMRTANTALMMPPSRRTTESTRPRRPAAAPSRPASSRSSSNDTDTARI